MWASLGAMCVQRYIQRPAYCSPIHSLHFHLKWECYNEMCKYVYNMFIIMYINHSSGNLHYFILLFCTKHTQTKSNNIYIIYNKMFIIYPSLSFLFEVDTIYLILAVGLAQWLASSFLTSETRVRSSDSEVCEIVQ